MMKTQCTGVYVMVMFIVLFSRPAAWEHNHLRASCSRVLSLVVSWHVPVEIELFNKVARYECVDHNSVNF